MNANNAIAAAVTALSLTGLTVLATVATFVDDVLRGFTLGGAVGTFIAYRRHQRDPELDPFPVITRWAGVGVVGGLALATITALA